MTNTASELLWPTDPELLLRCVCLYVGQGSSTLILASDGNGSYKTMLIDINLDQERGGINVPELLSDLLEAVDGRLDCFVNTHPHDDHLSGITELNEVLDIGEIWHSGHKPGREHEEAYEALIKVIEAVKTDGGKEKKLRGSREPDSWGVVSYYVLAPADYVTDDVEGEDPDTRYRRIHEQCAVLRFGVDDAWFLVTGDADRDAWEKHIANYHGKKTENRIASAVMTAPHHGSRTFFRYKEEDDPYEDAIELIAPKYVIISAPTQEGSPHGHPHTDAIDLYAEHVKAKSILHTGEQRNCFVCDIYGDGEYAIWPDKGRLVEAYLIDDGDEGADDSGGGQKGSKAYPVVSVVDRRPMGVM